MYVVQVSYEEDEERHELILVSRVYTESAASASGITAVRMSFGTSGQKSVSLLVSILPILIVLFPRLLWCHLNASVLNTAKSSLQNAVCVAS